MTDTYRPKILAIDDATANLLLLGTALSKEYDLQTATSGGVGLALAKQSTPDLILLDVMMPDMSGFEVCRQLKASDALKDVPIIFITALDGMEQELAGLALGAVDYITKPINLEITRLRIGNLLERERLRREVERQRDQLQEQALQQEQAQAALSASELRWRAIIEASPVPLALNDDQQNILYVNAAFVHAFGYTLQDIPTLSHWWPRAYPDPDYLQSVQARWQLHMEKSRQDNQPFEPLEVQVVCKDGQQRTVLIGSAPLGDSYAGTHLVTFFDITQRKALEQEASALNRSFVNFLEHTGDFVYFKDARSRFVFCSQTLADITGHASWRDMLGKHDLEVFPPDTAQIYFEEENQVLCDGQPLLDKIDPFYDRNGETGWVSTNKWPLFNRDGQVEGLFGISRDITKQRRDQQALAQSEALLRSVLDGIQDPVLLKDAKGKFLLCNQAVARLYNTTPQDMVGKDDADFGVPATLADAFRDNVLSIMARGQSEIVLEESRDAVSGEIRSYRSFKKPMRDADGRHQILVVAQDITEIRRSQAKVAESERRLRAVLEATREGIWDWHIPSSQVIHNQCWYDTLGLTRGQDADSVEAFSDLIHPDDKARVWQLLESLLQGTSEAYYSEHRLRQKSGQYIWAQDRGRVVERDPNGQPVRVVGSFSDITERKLAEEKLRLAASVFDNSREGITIAAPDGTIVDVNDAFTRITGFSRDEVLGRNPRILSSGRHGKEFYASMWHSLLDKGHWYGEIWNRRKSGEVYAEMLSISAVRDEAGVTRNFVALFSDITQMKSHQAQLEHIAHFDALTHLPNRVLLADRLRQGMAQALRRGQRLAVAFLDLDGFKAINDTHGHEAGDQLLIGLAERMRQCLRDGDSLARLGGDEFVAVLVDLDDLQTCLPTLTRLLAATAEPVHFGGIVLKVSASLGVTFYPQADDMDADQLLRQADQAMYQAKLGGKNRYHVFDAEQDRSVRGHHESLERIRQALAQREFVLYYQPKVNMRTGKIIGAEALIRWQHPQNGLLPPAVFLPVIEDHSLAVEVGEWVIGSALTQIALWQTAGLDIPVSVNIGARQLQQLDFVTQLRAMLAAHPEVKPSRLELEVLETSALEDLAHVAQVIEACRELGVMFALDDFGTGYSSLAYLKRLQVAQLKIDQTFVRDMLDDPDDLAILEAVLGLAAAFRMQVIAEGVETLEHGEVLLQLGCELAQGYGIARPMPAAALLRWVQDWTPDASWLGLPCISRSHLPLLFASVEHRTWILAMSHYLKGEREAPPALDHHQCRFGQWMQSEDAARHGGKPAFEAIGPLHQQIHTLALGLSELLTRGRKQEALEQLGELHALRDSLLAQLKILLREVAP